MAKKKRVNKRIEPPKPKRKIGRYILLLMLMAPLIYQARGVDFGAFVPEVNVKEKVKITNVIIEGELNYLNKEGLKDEIIRRLGDDFVRADLHLIQTATQGIPWVKTAAVSRVWPTSIKIEIEEQQPIARWGDSGFLNRYGEIIEVKDLSALTHFPILNGPDEDAYDIASRYMVFANLMSEFQLYVSALNVSDDGEWNIEVNRYFSIALGKYDLSKRLERFLYLYPSQLAALQKDIDHVDMRYKQGLTVKWKSANNADEQHKNT